MSSLRVLLPDDPSLNGAARGRPVVAVHPPEDLASRPRLFDAIGELSDVEFVPGGHGRQPDANVQFADRDSADNASDRGLPTFELRARSGGSEDLAKTVVEFAGSLSVERALRGARLNGPTAVAADDSASIGRSDILATAGGVAVWWREGQRDVVLSSLPELQVREPLRERLRTDPLPVCALVSFLRRAIPSLWKPPSTHASYLFDDPNLHGSSYGYIDYRELVAHATQHGYHVAFATIPLDGWFASRGAVDLFRSNPESLSLLMHGNDHVHRELGRAIPATAHRAALAQGLRRIRRFEARYGLRVDPVMAPPHGACSSEAATQLLLLGYEGLCVSRPYPWLENPPPDDPAAGCRPADSVVGGLPVIGRVPFSGVSRAELAMRAFLHQPLIVYGHHGDVHDGLDVLAAGAETIETLGDARWTGIGSIASALYETRADASRFDVRLWTRTAKVAVPDGIEEVTIRTGFELTAMDDITARVLTDGPEACGRTILVAIKRKDGIDPESVARPRPNVWSIPRRGLTELRDRSLPVVNKFERRRYAV